MSIARYEPAAMTLSVDARAAAGVATSGPAWTGWRVLVDGTPARPLTYNHAFVALEVPSGRHEVELRYFPTSFGVGLIVTVATLAAAALLLRQARTSPAP